LLPPPRGADPAGLVADPFILSVRESNSSIAWLFGSFYLIDNIFFFIYCDPSNSNAFIRDRTYFVAHLFAVWGRTISSFLP
jgi:hypothetical protein